MFLIQSIEEIHKKKNTDDCLNDFLKISWDCKFITIYIQL